LVKSSEIQFARARHQQAWSRRGLLLRRDRTPGERRGTGTASNVLALRRDRLAEVERVLHFRTIRRL
jgi:hypothetical protein